MSKKINYHTIGELFCGPGGGGLGASLAKIEAAGETHCFEHSWASDLDLDTCKTYSKSVLLSNEELSEKVICGDARELDLEDSNTFPAVEGFLFGFPCNDFSIVGETKGMSGKFGPLYKQGIRVLSRSDSPDWFLAENVGGIMSANKGKAFTTITKEMSDAGYDLVAHKYKFEEYGVPQKRHRIIIIGIKKELGLKFKVPKPFEYRVTTKTVLDNIPDHITHNERTNQSATVVERLKHLKAGQNAWQPDLPEHLQLNVKGARLSNIYKRLLPDQPAYTVTGSGGGGTHMYHWEEPRALTNRERARLQTFPDNFQFVGSRESIRKQVGMAIPPLGAKVILEAILKTLAGVEYDFIEPNLKLNI
jgi:DNA (cytosine-5)-methyltransferase 1